MALQTVPSWCTKLRIGWSPTQVASQPRHSSSSLENSGAAPLASHGRRFPCYSLGLLRLLSLGVGVCGRRWVRDSEEGPTVLFGLCSPSRSGTRPLLGATRRALGCHPTSSGLHALDSTARGKSRLTGKGLFKMSFLASFSLIRSGTCTELHNHSIYIQFWHLIL